MLISEWCSDCTAVYYDVPEDTQIAIVCMMQVRLMKGCRYLLVPYIECNIMFGHSQGHCAAGCSAKCEVVHAMHKHCDWTNLHCSRLHARAPLLRQARGTRRSRRAASSMRGQCAQVSRPEAFCAARRQMLQIAAIGTIVLPLYCPAYAASDGSRFITSSSGLKIEDIREGTGTTPAPGAYSPCNAVMM